MDEIVIGFWIGAISTIVMFLISGRKYHTIRKDSDLAKRLEKEGYKPNYKFWLEKK